MTTDQGGRPGIGPQISISFPTDLTEAVDDRARQLGTSRAHLIRQYVSAGLASATTGLQIHGVRPDGQPTPAHLDWDGRAVRWTVGAVGTKTLGYVHPVDVRIGDEGITTKYRAVYHDGRELNEGDPAPTKEDAAALIVLAAHS
jgi:hypothetical protein